MADSVYKVIELIGTSKESWEKAAAAAVSRAGSVAARSPRRRGREAGSATGRQRQGRSVPRQGERLVQVRGLSEACEGWAKAKRRAHLLNGNTVRHGGARFALPILSGERVNDGTSGCIGVTAPAARSHRH